MPENSKKWILAIGALVSLGLIVYFFFVPRGFKSPPVREFTLYDENGQKFANVIDVPAKTRGLKLFASMKPGTAVDSDFDGKKVLPASEWGLYATVYRKKSDAGRVPTDWFCEFWRYLTPEELLQSENQLQLEIPRDPMQPAPAIPIEVLERLKASQEPPIFAKLGKMGRPSRSWQPKTPPVKSDDGEFLYAGLFGLPSEPGEYYLQVFVCPALERTHTSDLWNRKVIVFEGTIKIGGS